MLVKYKKCCDKQSEGFERHMELNHLIDFNEMALSDWESLCTTISDIIQNPVRYADACKGKVLATPFFEPSTRTIFSFQAAALRLGAAYIGFSDPYNSSVAKGETLKDTIRTIANYVDAIAMRHPLEGAAKAASLFSAVPVINAGDGGHMHPTQTLADLTTLRRRFGKIENISIGFCGDLKNGRTVHSLIKAMTRFPGNRFYLISTPELRVPEYIRQTMRSTGHAFTELFTLEECMDKLDVLYMTRIQKERFASEEEYRTQAGVYVLTADKMRIARSDMIVMHPLPKVDEITEEVDEDPRCVYFEQAENGMYARMGLLYHLMYHKKERPPVVRSNVEELRCRNPKCISNHERYLPQRFKRPAINPAELVCEYCDTPARL